MQTKRFILKILKKDRIEKIDQLLVPIFHKVLQTVPHFSLAFLKAFPSRGVRSNSAQKNARDDRNERNLTGMSGIDKKNARNERNLSGTKNARNERNLSGKKNARNERNLIGIKNAGNERNLT